MPALLPKSARGDRESQIPVGTQFSPTLIDLSAYVRMVVENSGNEQILKKKVVLPPVRKKVYVSQPTKRMIGLPLEAGVQYGLLTRGTYEATDLAKELAKLQEPQIHEAFARHILVNLNGLRVVEAIQEMERDHKKITGDSLAQYLTDQGSRVTVHNTAINTMRMWLAEAGLFPKAKKNNEAWIPDREIKKKLLGMDDEVIAALASLSQEQIAFTRALCRLEPEGWILASDVRDLAETSFAVRFGRSSLPNEILKPLQEAGFIEYTTRGTKGGKASKLRITEKFKTEVIKPFLERTLGSLNLALTAYYQTRPADFFGEMQSPDTYKKGRALEAFTIYVMRILGLRFLGWRRRARETGQSEVDVLLAGLSGGMPTTWQVQCKNTPSSPVRLEDVAKEVGLLPLTNATHILVIANSSFTEDARKFVMQTMLKSPVTIFLLGKKDFDVIRTDPTRIGGILRSQAERITDYRIKTPLWSGITPPD
jgi:hypothetical protein